MWLYKETAGLGWEVGFYEPGGYCHWHQSSVHHDRESAEAYVNYLNGGDGRPFSPDEQFPNGCIKVSGAGARITIGDKAIEKLSEGKAKT